MDKFHAANLALAEFARKQPMQQPGSTQPLPELRPLEVAELLIVGGGDQTPCW
jgi:hypothetical protein